MTPDLMQLLQATGGLPQMTPQVSPAAVGPEAPGGLTGWLMGRGLDAKQAEAFPGLMANMGKNLSAQPQQSAPPPPPMGTVGNPAAVQAAIQMMMQNIRRR